MSGIGVENWILHNGGNLIRAFTTFYETAFTLDPDGNPAQLSFGEFQQNYHVYNAGFNLIHQVHDDYIALMKPEGYAKLCEIVREYLASIDKLPELRSERNGT